MKKIKLYITVVFTLLAAGLSSVPVYARHMRRHQDATRHL
jgi:hypothetical protein